MSDADLNFSDLIPGQAGFLEGEYDIDGPFTIRCTEAASLGDMYWAEVAFTSKSGIADGAFVGTDNCFVEWGNYDIDGDLSVSANLLNPFVHLHFQLEGSMSAQNFPASLRTPLRGGDTNLTYTPALHNSFSLDDRIEGEVFSILLSKPYFADLAARHPQLFGTYYESILREKSFALRDRHLRITPQMWGIIRRIRRRSTHHAAGSLFLEAQILELLSLQLAQLDEPAHRNDVALSSGDADRLHHARDLLLRDLSDAPTLAELARAVGTNEYKLKRGFKSLFGNTPYGFFLEHRLELARNCLLETDWTVAEIAYHVGYSDPAHLTNAFRKHFGIRPSDLR